MSKIDLDHKSSLAQRDQFGSPLPASPAVADQIDPLLATSGNHTDDPPLLPTPSQVREQQQVDLVMLRLSFRQFYRANNDAQQPRKDTVVEDTDEDGPLVDAPGGSQNSGPQLPDLSISDFSHLVSAIAKMHDEERIAYGVEKAAEPTVDKEDQEYEQFSKLSKRELIQFCHDNHIVPPDLCDLEDQSDGLS